MAALAALGLTLGACRRPVPPPGETTPPSATPTPPPPLPTPSLLPPLPTPPTPPPAPFVPNKKLEVGRIFNGMQYKATLETEIGTTATADRNEPSSYSAELVVRVRVPQPHKSLEQISKLNAQLATVLPGLPTLMESAKVSPFFEDLYKLKVANLRANMNRLDNLLTRHNFFDTETVLELQDTNTKRRALLVQSDMDVDEDGSDSDRVPLVDGSSVTFQPFTSYKWAKKTPLPNSFITPREQRIHRYQLELAGAGVLPLRARELKETIAQLRSEIADLKKYSYLVGASDPFVVLPGSMFGKAKGLYAPMVGDYCVVIFGDILYPAIVGDVGPPYKSGEGSLRLCKQINARSDTNNRAVNDLKVTYLVFPNSGDKPWETPDLDRWRARCSQLLQEIGGYSGELFTWVDLTKPPEFLGPPAPVLTTPAPVPATPAPATPAPATPVPATPAPIIPRS